MNDFIKITEEKLYSESFILRENIVDRVNTFFTGHSADFEFSLMESLVGCESPIEQLFAMEIERTDLARINRYNPAIDVLSIEKQAEIIADSKKYRADFLFVVEYRLPKNSVTISYIVECDGFDFHSNKAQMKRDYERTRALSEAGYEVIKFTGSEIYTSPYKCVDQLISRIVKKAELLKSRR